MIKEFTYGSVCSGIEAATVAWHPLGWTPAWFAEIEPFPAAVLAHHYPTVANLGDMTRIASLVRMGFVPAPDALVGGTPCQAFSVAGVRLGLSDPRGQLTLAYADLADAIDEKRPGDECVIYWENVPGVLSSEDNAFGCFLALLAGEDIELTPEPKPADGKNSKYWKWDKENAEHTCRWPNVGCVYGSKRAIAWRVLDAQYFGVAQRRRRVFVVASARKGFDPAKLLFESDGVRRDTPPSRETGQEIAGALSSHTSGGGGLGTDFDLAGGLQVSNAEGATGLPFLTASNIGKTVNNQTPLLYANPVSPTLRAGGNTTGGDRPPGTDVDTADSLVAYAFQPRIARNGRGDMGDLVSALTAQAGETGKGDAAPCVAYAFDSRQDTVFSRHLFGSLSSSSPQAQAVNYRSAVRRLTPRECERLQGFPDNYTLIPYGRRVKKEKLDLDFIKYQMRGNPKHLTRDDIDRLAADGPRYKALGNSMAVPCMRWLGMRLMLTHPELFRLDRIAA